MGTRLGKYTFVATTLTFGWEPSPGIYSVAATAISSYHTAHVPENPRDNGGESLASVTYVDDGILIAVDIGVLPEVCARVYELGMVLTLGEGAVSLDKLEAEGAWETVTSCLGIVFDTVKEEVRLSSARIQRLEVFLRQPLCARGKRQTLL